MSCCFDCVRTLRTFCARNDVHVSFRAPPVRACDFLLRGQEKVTKEKATPRTRPSPIHGLRVRSRSPGFADDTSMYPRRTGALPVRHPAGDSVVRSPCSRGPVWRASCARGATRYVGCSRRERGHGWPVVEAVNAPLHGAEHRSAKREQGAHVRAQGCATKSAGTADLNAAGGPECRRRASHRDVASSSRRLAWRETRREVSATRCCRNRRARRNGLWLLSAETESSSRAVEARETQVPKSYSTQEVAP